MKVKYNEKEITFFISKMKKINLDALNLVAIKDESILCSCSYCEVKKWHCITYYAPWQKQQCTENEKVIIQAILEILDVIQKHHLQMANFILRKDSIFVGETIKQFLYLPLITKKTMSCRKFVLQIMQVMGMKEFCAYAELKKMNDSTSVETILMYLTKCIQEPSAVENQNEADTSLLNQDEGETTLLNQNDEPKPDENEGETTFLTHASENGSDNIILSQHTTEFIPNKYDECETTFLSDDILLDAPRQNIPNTTDCQLYLLRTCSGELIRINRSVFSIGKDYSTMDYVLGNESVSRNHASIYTEGNTFYLVDNGSTNGTIMEGIRLQKGERAELDDGYIISLGNEVFQVLIERNNL